MWCFNYGYLPSLRWYSCASPQGDGQAKVKVGGSLDSATVAHPSNNNNKQVQCKVTLLIEISAWYCHAKPPSHYFDAYTITRLNSISALNVTSGKGPSLLACPHYNVEMLIHTPHSMDGGMVGIIKHQLSIKRNKKWHAHSCHKKSVEEIPTALLSLIKRKT